MSRRHRLISFKWSFKPPRSTAGHTQGINADTTQGPRIGLGLGWGITCVGLKIHSTSHGIENGFWLFKYLLLHKCTEVTWSNKHQQDESILILLHYHCLAFNQEEKLLCSHRDTYIGHYRLRRVSPGIVPSETHGDESGQAWLLSSVCISYPAAWGREGCKQQMRGWPSWAMLLLARPQESTMLYFLLPPYLGKCTWSKSKEIDHFSKPNTLLTSVLKQKRKTPFEKDHFSRALIWMKPDTIPDLLRGVMPDACQQVCRRAGSALCDKQMHDVQHCSISECCPPQRTCRKSDMKQIEQVRIGRGRCRYRSGKGSLREWRFTGND